MSNEKYEILTIEAYKAWKGKKNPYSRPVEGMLQLQVNPEKYTIQYSVEYNSKKQPEGTRGYSPSWSKNPPRKLSFEFIIDGTGAFPLPAGVNAKEWNNVEQRLMDFKEMVFDTQAASHQPNYLKIMWGQLVFKCRLTNMTVTYKLFSPDGKLLRVLVNATFQDVLPEAEAKKLPEYYSADLTHQRTAIAGDRLPLLAEDIYDDELYYMAVAQANKLIHFRDLKPGTEIYFPPVKRV